jgi:penicillin-binding protein 1A
MAIRKVILPGDREDTSAGWGEPRRRRVMSEEEAYVVTKILEDNMRYGTGTGAALVRPAAGKTGTTDDHADAWFAGYTPDLTTVVWVGYPQGEIPMENVHGISVSGGTFPARIWRGFMQRALWDSPPQDWVVPAELPDWVPWERGDHVLSYDPYVAPETTETTEETTTEEVEEPDEEQAEPSPPPPPATPD